MSSNDQCGCPPEPNACQHDQAAPQCPAPPPSQDEGVCKRDAALAQMIAEQQRPPPIQVNLKVGVPNRKGQCDSGPVEEKGKKQADQCAPPPPSQADVCAVNTKKGADKCPPPPTCPGTDKSPPEKESKKDKKADKKKC